MSRRRRALYRRPVDRRLAGRTVPRGGRGADAGRADADRGARRAGRRRRRGQDLPSVLGRRPRAYPSAAQRAADGPVLPDRRRRAGQCRGLPDGGCGVRRHGRCAGRREAHRGRRPRGDHDGGACCDGRRVMPTNPKPIDLLCMGEPMLAFNQLPPDPDGRVLYLEGHGGDTSNAAIAAARQGARVGYITAIGKDAPGDSLMALWAREAVDTATVTRTDKALTGVYFVTHDERGHHFLYYRNDSPAALYASADLPREA